ncbi:fatty acid desaturase family protein [Synoicihabitans lomoniglobus]|nr:fatty acid desaturase [Opitutaceae bacterium LMO-M01]
MLKKFRHDPYFLFKYNVLSVVLLAPVSVGIFLTWSSWGEHPYGWGLLLCIAPLCLPSLWSILGSAVILVPVASALGLVEFSMSSWWLIPLGALVGLQSAHLMHNAAHRNLRPLWLNRVVGEICGLQQLMGYPHWAVPHIIHHQFPDDPEKDPHPPETLDFLSFMGQMGQSMGRVVQNNFFDLWGGQKDAQAIWDWTRRTSMASRYARAMFLLVLLGPEAFVLGYMVSKIVNMVWYAHFNYATHRPAGNGETKILNLDHNLYYRFMNATMAGAYYHKNHHAQASLADPRKLNPIPAEPFISYRAEEVVPESEKPTGS